MLKILEHSLKEDGMFAVTFMDKTQVLDLIGKNDQFIRESENEIAYYIKQFNGESSRIGYGDHIRIVTSGNNVLKEGSNEYLIDYKIFCEKMHQSGFVLSENVLFKDMYNDFVHKYNLEPLSNIEKEISFLNRMCVFQKRKSELSVSPMTHMKTQCVNEKTLFNFETIQLQQNGVNVFKVSTKYEIVDLINCVEHIYYKNCIDDQPITCFEDIVGTFEELEMTYTPVYIKDPLKYSSDTTTTKYSTIYFTNYKHVVEKKNITGDTETTEYDNWYVVMYKNKLLGVGIQLSKTKDENECENPNRKLQIMLELENNPKTTLKILKTYIGELGLKVSGKKDELYNRIMECCKRHSSIPLKK
jgi:hypothetical protein